ncbi:MAG: hypothetical protein GKR91_11390 [Pseudomonadales bacterium]|nr:hypothetical protein [Pseudomonadales bacterium]
MKIACIGDCKSFTETGSHSHGDVLATAVYLARAGLDVYFIGAIEDGLLISDFRNCLTEEGINSEFVSNSSAADFFSADGLASLAGSVDQFDYIYLTGKVLSLIKEEGCNCLFKILRKFRADGGKVVFDCDHGSSKWNSEEQAINTYKDLLEITDISLPNFEEESLLFNDANVEELIARHHKLGIDEIVVKNGTNPNWLSTKPEKPPKEFPIESIQSALNPNGAGSAFNAAYIATRLSGKTYCGSIEQGQILAAKVVLNAGVIPSK